MTLFDGILVLLAMLGLALIFIHSTIMDKIGLRAFWEKSHFFKELFNCSMCCPFWFGFYGVLCIWLKLEYNSFWFYVMTVPFASSGFCYFTERIAILADEGINKLIKKKTVDKRIRRR